MSDLFFDLQAILALEKEKGDVVEICQKSPLSQIDYDYGVKAESELECQRVNGYIIKKKYSDIKLENGNALTSAYTTYVNAVGFDPASVRESTLIRVNGKTFQIEADEPILHRGKVIYYVFQLQETKVDTPAVK